MFLKRDTFFIDNDYKRSFLKATVQQTLRGRAFDDSSGELLFFATSSWVVCNNESIPINQRLLIFSLLHFIFNFQFVRINLIEPCQGNHCANITHQINHAKTIYNNPTACSEFRMEFVTMFFYSIFHLMSLKLEAQVCWLQTHVPFSFNQPQFSLDFSSSNLINNCLAY